MSAAHTPGPWRAVFDPMGGYDCLSDAWQIRANNNPEPVAAVDLRGYSATLYGRGSDACAIRDQAYATATANARLIAAAPELLACLLDVLDADGDLYAMEFDRYRDAIIKATGEA